MKRNIRKRKNRKEICALCIGACLCAFLLTGCGKEEADTENDFSVTLPTGPEDSDVYIEAIPDIFFGQLLLLIRDDAIED